MIQRGDKFKTSKKNYFFLQLAHRLWNWLLHDITRHKNLESDQKRGWTFYINNKNI